MIRIGLAGCGRWGRLILRDLQALGCEVVVAVPSNEGRRAALAAGATHAVGTVGELPECDAYVVAVPTVSHGEVVLELAARGRPLFCEKPLTANVDSARRIVEAAGERVFVMDKWRYHPGVHLLRDIARSQELGPVQGIHATRVQWGCPHTDVDPAWILMPHDLSIALEILGDLPTPKLAHAESDDQGLTTLKAWLDGPVWMHCEVGVRSPQHRRVIELRCRDGVAVLGDAYDEHVAVLRTRGRSTSRPAPEWERRPFAASMPLLDELACFVAWVAGTGPAPKSSAQEGLRIVEAVAQIRALAGLEEDR
ncbi:Predicted dehydrogenase [Variovorax sp. YR750]|uniref:Gfo/Idh/MocA family protein n=1 Tax=Variovorax sp. YR750 TaxID=1884384 RepID=UPI0008B03751|nr:Gfo/Idh/MocA family oxidoreductase [Variovorax sp. YR750]MDP9605602.1 putative dehydrogenase [Variovorax paradoxus]SEL16443.1 Predicted dehydrogenase [Variovorax sp. YR750]